MAKKKSTAQDVVVGFCLDESGSMQACGQPTIDGFNRFVEGLREQDGQTTMFVTKFSRLGPAAPTFRPLMHGLSAKKLALSWANYHPDGDTPLYDAIGHTIAELDKWLSAQATKPLVQFVIQTDGFENASREFGREQIVDLIRVREAQGWKFIYLGAEQSDLTAERTATAMGMNVGSSIGYAGSTADAAFASVAVGTQYLRSRGKAMTSAEMATATRAAYEQEVAPSRPKKAKQRRRLA